MFTGHAYNHKFCDLLKSHWEKDDFEMLERLPCGFDQNEYFSDARSRFIYSLEKKILN